MPALISLATEADAGTWRAVLPYLAFPVTEYQPRLLSIPTLGSGIEGHPPEGTSGSGIAGCIDGLRMDGKAEGSPADKLEASAGDFADRDGMVGGESGAPHGGPDSGPVGSLSAGLSDELSSEAAL